MNNDYKTFNGTDINDLINNLPAINDNADTINYGLFETYGTYDSSELRHTCVLCNKKCSIDDSFSSRGHRLICLSCVYKYFEGDYAAVFVWNKED